MQHERDQLAEDRRKTEQLQQMLVRKTKMMEKEAKDKEREEEKLRSQRERFSNMLGWRQTLQSTEKKQAKVRERKEKARRDAARAESERLRQELDAVRSPSPVPFMLEVLSARGGSPGGSPLGQRAQQIAHLLDQVNASPPKKSMYPDAEVLAAAKARVRSESVLAARPAIPFSVSRSASVPDTRPPAQTRMFPTIRAQLWTSQKETGARMGEGFGAPVSRRAGGAKVNAPVCV